MGDHTTLPDHRSPWIRAGGSSGPARSVILTDQALDREHVGPPDVSAVGGELEVGQDPPDGVELRPRRRGLVGQRQRADVAVVRGTELVGTAGVQPGERAARGRRHSRGSAGRARSSRSPGSPPRPPAPRAHRSRPARASQRSPSPSVAKKSAGALARVFTSTELPLLRRTRVDVQMSPPATGVVATTAWPSSSSTRVAIPRIRAIAPLCRAGGRGARFRVGQRTGLVAPSRASRWVPVEALARHRHGRPEAGAALVRVGHGQRHVVEPHGEVLRQRAAVTGRLGDVPAVHRDLQRPDEREGVAAEVEVADADRGGREPPSPRGLGGAGALDDAVDDLVRVEVVRVARRPRRCRARPPRRWRSGSPPCAAGAARGPSARTAWARSSGVVRACCRQLWVQVTALSRTATDLGGDAVVMTPARPSACTTRAGWSGARRSRTAHARRTPRRG